jgi:hypothetical protein
MQTLLSWIAFGLGTLFFVACVVAWWEHLGREGQRAEEPGWDAPPGRLASVDVDLDALPAADWAAGDVGERRQALGGAITRMASGDRRQGFGDTLPMILAGAAEVAPPDPVTAERRQHDKAAAGA